MISDSGRLYGGKAGLAVILYGKPDGQYGCTVRRFCGKIWLTVAAAGGAPGRARPRCGMVSLETGRCRNSLTWFVITLDGGAGVVVVVGCRNRWRSIVITLDGDAGR